MSGTFFRKNVQTPGAELRSAPASVDRGSRSVWSVIMEEECVALRDLMSGDNLPENLSEVEGCRDHWQECEDCQRSLPNAMKQLDAIVEETLSDIRHHLQRLHDEYREEEKRIVAEDDRRERELRKSVEIRKEGETRVVEFKVSAPYTLFMRQPKMHTQLIMALAAAGKSTQGYLQIMNDRWGLDYFHIAPGQDACEYDSLVCAPFIASLSEDVKVFVFEAVLAADVMETFKNELSVECGSTIYRVIQHAAPEFLRRYLEKELKSLPPRATEKPWPPPSRLNSRLFPSGFRMSLKA